MATLLIRSMLKHLQILSTGVFDRVVSSSLLSFYQHVTQDTKEDTQNDDPVNGKENGKDLSLFCSWTKVSVADWNVSTRYDKFVSERLFQDRRNHSIGHPLFTLTCGENDDREIHRIDNRPASVKKIGIRNDSDGEIQQGVEDGLMERIKRLRPRLISIGQTR